MIFSQIPSRISSELHVAMSDVFRKYSTGEEGIEMQRRFAYAEVCALFMTERDDVGMNDVGDFMFAARALVEYMDDVRDGREGDFSVDEKEVAIAALINPHKIYLVMQLAGFRQCTREGIWNTGIPQSSILRIPENLIGDYHAWHAECFNPSRPEANAFRK